MRFNLKWIIVLILLFFLSFFVFNEYKRISVVSDVSDWQVKVNWKNYWQLRSYLQSLNFFNKDKITLRDINEKNVTVKKIVVHLTNSKYIHNKFQYADKTYMYSTDEEFSNGKLDLYIGINDKLFFNKNDIKSLNYIFTQEFFLSTMELAKPEVYSEMDGFSGLEKISGIAGYYNKIKDNNLFFMVKPIK